MEPFVVFARPFILTCIDDIIRKMREDDKDLISVADGDDGSFVFESWDRLFVDPCIRVVTEHIAPNVDLCVQQVAYRSMAAMLSVGFEGLRLSDEQQMGVVMAMLPTHVARLLGDILVENQLVVLTADSRMMRCVPCPHGLTVLTKCHSDGYCKYMMDRNLDSDDSSHPFSPGHAFVSVDDLLRHINAVCPWKESCMVARIHAMLVYAGLLRRLADVEMKPPTIGVVDELVCMTYRDYMYDIYQCFTWLDEGDEGKYVVIPRIELDCIHAFHGRGLRRGGDIPMELTVAVRGWAAISWWLKSPT